MLHKESYYGLNYGWRKSYSSVFIFSVVMSCILGFLIFKDLLVDFGYIIYALITVFIFFKGLEVLPYSFNRPDFLKKMFLYTFSIRMIFVIFLYIYYASLDGPYEALFPPNATDATGYHLLTKWMARDFWNSGINGINFKYYIDMTGGVSDMGYIFWMLPWYILVGPYLWLHGLTNLIFGSWSVILIYKIAKNQFNHEVGILAAIMMMLYPSFYNYSSEALKEIVMIWLLLYAILYFQNFLIKKGNPAWNLTIAILFTFSLIYFRTFLVALVLGSFVTAVFFGSKKRNLIVTLIYAILGIIGFVKISQVVGYREQIEQVVNLSSGAFDAVLTRYQGHKLGLKIASIPLFILYSIPGPLATIVKSGNQQNIWLVSGGLYVRNLMMFFYLIGIFNLTKKAFKENLFIFTFTIGYLFVMGYSGYATSSRYHLVATPFLLIYSALGITTVKGKHQKWLKPFLVGLVFFIISWNYFKLAGRGLI